MDAGSTLCYYNSFEYQLVMRIELIIVAYLSAMRYLIICHNITKSTRFWLISLSFGFIPPLAIYIYGAILHQDKPSQSYLACIGFTTPNEANFIIYCLIPFLFLIPSWVITFCYICIGLKVNKQLNQMKAEAIENRDFNLLRAIKLQKVKIIIQISLVIILYNANFSLAYISLILKFAIGYKRSPIAEAMSYFTTLLTFTLNPILTITFQPELNHELYVLLFRFSLKIKKLFSRFFQ
ncbi:hypothetical protein CONCODRAFT_13464 [Conidiobolus coronatus NRRL 28638]|uniref:G-protein coupled receptors family 1 profile domain-containing protein n=1 Tax=Conidiobolus coronatus (strain ATCC 28846 / CBS 209.66 / NRRL 28638) TaxID=796925 RepID=A0A137NQP4_CONC2|nr:hypothetical protein CONCODRAFT_13464 [Conidiobolus coronatus NRRL 28638]|eukprot:KXN65079.1 hypothetical protein CONCODRAFT_13464 [Conidiobolus coronatus NRRL 28638]